MHRSLLALLLVLAAHSAAASLIPVTLYTVNTGGGQERFNGQLSGTLTGVYDSAANTIQMDPGAFSVAFRTNPLVPDSAIWIDTLSDAVWDLDDGALSVSSYSCANSGFSQAIDKISRFVEAQCDGVSSSS